MWKKLHDAFIQIHNPERFRAVRVLITLILLLVWCKILFF